MPTRIVCVQYLNTAPLIEGLEKLGDVELIPTVPSRIGRAIVAGEGEVGLASLIDAARSPLAILDAGMIGSDGPTMTVRLFSAIPFERVRVLHADTDSHTSVILASVILHHVYGTTPQVLPFSPCAPAAPRLCDPASWPESFLLIGDKVVTDAPPEDRYPHQLDLGRAWKEWTGLPFVYAAWMCRAGEEESRAVRTACAILDRQRRRNAMRLDWITERRARAHGWPVDRAREYVGELLRFDLGPRERAGAERFIAEAAAMGLAPRTELRWATGLTPVAAT